MTHCAESLEKVSPKKQLQRSPYAMCHICIYSAVSREKELCLTSLYLAPREKAARSMCSFILQISPFASLWALDAPQVAGWGGDVSCVLDRQG